MSTDRIAASFGQDLHPWMQDAACHGVDMFPGRTTRETRGAKAVCAGCPVALPCLRYAIDERIEWGVWGGMSETERANIRKGAVA